MVAYEPVWRSAPAQCDAGKHRTRTSLFKRVGHLSRRGGVRLVIQYGGSAAGKCGTLLGRPDVDGAGGGASLKASDFDDY